MWISNFKKYFHVRLGPVSWYTYYAIVQSTTLGFTTNACYCFPHNQLNYYQRRILLTHNWRNYSINISSTGDRSCLLNPFECRTLIPEIEVYPITWIWSIIPRLYPRQSPLGNMPHAVPRTHSAWNMQCPCMATTSMSDSMLHHNISYVWYRRKCLRFSNHTAVWHASQQPRCWACCIIAKQFDHANTQFRSSNIKEILRSAVS